MGMYNFDSDFTVKDLSAVKNFPLGMNEYPAVKQIDHNLPRQKINGEYEAYPYNVEEFLTPGFRSLDDAMKNYFSGVRVPTKDSYRFMRVKVAGGDKSILIWADDLKEGRVRLPLAALSRDSMEFNQDKYSPIYHSMGHRFVNSSGTKVAKLYRPVPYLVKYTMTIWAEFKRDAEYILHQLMVRYNPIAEFKMWDGHIAGSVQLRFDGVTDASDKENGFDQHAAVRYELSTTAEAWLPLPEKIVPTVLGTVGSIKEMTASIVMDGNPIVASAWSEPLNYQGY
jgi:hypothetical protein